MTDVLILYEHRSREIENACLLATELENRGYRTKIKNIYALSKYFTKGKVVIVPHLYNDVQVISFAKNFWFSNDAIIDLQYEQVLNDENENGIHNPKEQAVYAQHISWGEAQKEVYLTHGIAEKNIHMVGHIAMDLLREEFSKYFISKKDIANEFNLSEKKQWVLFISSFSYVNRSETEIMQLASLNKSAFAFNKVSNASYIKILEWLKWAALNHNEYEFIYRKHPAEKKSSELINLEKTINNFHCIDNYSVRQWIRLADKLYTWFSTSIVDAYFAGKNCEILRPISLEKKLESQIMKNADFLCSYVSFERTLENGRVMFPIKDNMIKFYYGNGKNKMAYQSIVDLCEKMISDEKLKHKYNYGPSRLDMHNYKKLNMIIKDYFNGILFEIAMRFDIKIPCKNRHYDKIEMYKKEGLYVKKEIVQYKKRFKRVLETINEEIKENTLYE